VLGDLDHDVIRVEFRVVVVALQTLQAGRAGGQDLDLAGMAAGADLIHADAHFLFLAKAHLGGNVGPRDGQRAGFAAAAIVLFDDAVLRAVHEGVHHGERIVLLDGRVAGVMVEVTHTGDVIQAHAFFHQIFVNVDDLTAGEDLVEFIALELIETGAAAHHHGFDVEIVQRIRHAMKQHPIVRDDLIRLVHFSGAALGIAAAQVSGRQHGLHAHMPQHGLGGEPHLGEQALGAAAGKIKHGLRLAAGGLGVANNGHVVAVFDVEQRAGGALGQAARHALVDEVNDLFLDRRFPRRRRRPLGLRLRQRIQRPVGQALRLVSPVDHDLAGQLDGLRIGGVQEEHGRRGAGVEALLAHAAQ
jgi:hypothetical protein